MTDKGYTFISNQTGIPGELSDTITTVQLTNEDLSLYEVVEGFRMFLLGVGFGKETVEKIVVED